jgi:hypothetical protein
LNKFVKKDHPSVAARLARRHVARAAWAKDGKDMPPQPTPARCLPWPSSPSPLESGPCRLSSRRHADVAACHHRRWRHPLEPASRRQPATSPCRRWHWRHGPLRLTAVTCQQTCRLWGWRHPLAVVGPGGMCHVSPDVPPPLGGLF